MNIKLSQPMLQNLEQLGYTNLTPIQKETLPVTLTGEDIIAKAQTGSGKSAAFSIPLIERLDIKRHGVQALILCPTRELAKQVTKEIRKIARAKPNSKVLLLSGGESFGYQLSSLRHEAHIIVGTPGRVLKHLNKGTLVLDKLNSVVLDEADRLLDMGFIEEIESILSFAPKSRQTMLFSATFSDEVLDISKMFQTNAVKIEIDATDSKPNIKELFYQINRDKKEAIVDILADKKPSSTIIFCNQKIVCDEVADYLFRNDIDALAIHGDMEQIDRTETLVEFSNGSATVLVATDVAARGVDIANVECVINYDIPNSSETYTHRVGRTARAGKSGLAVTLFKNQERLYEVAPNFDGSIYNPEEANNFKLLAKYKTICIYGGRKDKLRAGDILGALAKDAKIEPKAIGKIDVGDRFTYVAIEKEYIDNAYSYLLNGKVKNRKFRVEKLN